jgi:hypothetical protein
MGRESDDDDGRDTPTPGSAPGGRDADVGLAPLRALIAADLAPAEARGLIERALAAAGGTATLALGARLAMDRRRPRSWLGGLVLGLTTTPRPELWPVVALAADDAVPGAAGALIACGPGAVARFLAGCDGQRARRLALVCAGTAAPVTVRRELAVARGGLFTPVERRVLEELEAAMVTLARDVLAPD